MYSRTPQIPASPEARAPYITQCGAVRPLWPQFRIWWVQSVTEALCVLSHLRLCDPIDCSPPGSSIRAICQARILEWVAISHSRGSSWPRDRICVSWVSHIGRSPPGKPSYRWNSALKEGWYYTHLSMVCLYSVKTDTVFRRIKSW